MKKPTEKKKIIPARSHPHLGASLMSLTQDKEQNSSARSHLASSSTNTTAAARNHLHLGASPGTPSQEAGGHFHLSASRRPPAQQQADSAPGTPSAAIDEETYALLEANRYSPNSARRLLFGDDENEENNMEHDDCDSQRIAEIIHNQQLDGLNKYMADHGIGTDTVQALCENINKTTNQEQRRKREEDEETSSSKRHNANSTPPRSPNKRPDPAPQQERHNANPTPPRSPNKRPDPAPQQARKAEWALKPATSNKVTTSRKQAQKPAETTTVTTTEKAPPKPPRILAEGVDPKLFSKALAEKGITVNYKKAGDKLAIKCNTSAHHATVMELLRTEYMGGFSFTPKDLKKTIMLMKDVHYTIPIEDVKRAIKEQSGLEVEAKRYETPRSRNKGYVLDIVMVTTDEQSVKDLVKTKHVENVIVKWDRMLKKDITQCHRCQQFGHISDYCLNPFKCVKCKDEHGPGECKRNAETDKPEDVWCTNCGKKGHPASFRGCPKALALLKKVENRKATKNINAARRAHIDAALNNYVGTETYAQMTSRGLVQPHYPPLPQRHAPPQQQATQAPQQPPPPTGFLGDEFIRHFGMDMFAIMERARAFMPRYKQMRSASEQQVALLDFIFTLC